MHNLAVPMASLYASREYEECEERMQLSNHNLTEIAHDRTFSPGPRPVATRAALGEQ